MIRDDSRLGQWNWSITDIQSVLIDAGAIEKTNPPSRSLKLFLTNKEACLAIPSRKYAFDITPLQVPGTQRVILKIDGWNQPLEYRY